MAGAVHPFPLEVRGVCVSAGEMGVHWGNIPSLLSFIGMCAASLAGPNIAEHLLVLWLAL